MCLRTGLGVLAAPAETSTVTGDPMTVAPLRILNVSVPSLTTPAELVTVAMRGTVDVPTLNVAEARDGARKPPW